MFELSKSESLRDVSITRIGDTLSYGFPQTDMEIQKEALKSLMTSCLFHGFYRPDTY